MPSNRQNSHATSSASVNSFSLLAEGLQSSNDADEDTIEVGAETGVDAYFTCRATSRKRPSTSPPSPPPARRSDKKANTRNDLVLDALARIEATLERTEERAKRAEERAERAEKRLEQLEKLVRKVGDTQLPPPPPVPAASGSSPPPLSTALQPSSPPFRVPGINLDLSRAPTLLKCTPGEIRERINASLKACGLQARGLD